MGSDKIWVAICSVLDLYNCSILVSSVRTVQHIAILQEMVYILFSFSEYTPFLGVNEAARLTCVSMWVWLLSIIRGVFLRRGCQPERTKAPSLVEHICADVTALTPFIRLRVACSLWLLASEPR